MRKLIVGFTLLMLLACYAQAATVDIRDYIDSGARYSQADSLDTAGQYSDVVWFTGARTLACDVHVTAITTNVVVRLECSNDNVNFMNCDTDGNDITITADGQYSIVYTYAAVHRYYRLCFVSEAGGTAAKMGISFRVGDGI